MIKFCKQTILWNLWPQIGNILNEKLFPTQINKCDTEILTMLALKQILDQLKSWYCT